MKTRAWMVGLWMAVWLATSVSADAVIEDSVAFTDQVNAVAIDHDGKVWTGTTGGVVRWDSADAAAPPVRWTAADGLPDNWISDVVVAPNGRVWVSMATWLGGVSTLLDGHWMTFDERNGLARDFVYDLAVDPEGNVWVATSDGLCVLTPMPDAVSAELDARITILAWDGDPAASRGQGVAVDARGRVWLWQNWGNVVVLDPGGTPHDASDDRWIVYAADDVSLASPIEKVVPDPWGRVWITHPSAGSMVFDDGGTFDPEDDLTAAYRAADGFPPDATGDIQFDGDGRLWLTGTQTAIHVFAGAETPFDRSDDIWQSIPIPPGLRPWSQRGFILGQEMDLWLIAGNREGAVRLCHGGTLEDSSDDTWERFVVESRLAGQDVRGFAFAGDQVWIACDGGVVVESDAGRQSALSASVYAIASQDSVAWAGTWGGLFALEQVDGDVITTRYTIEQGLADNYVRSVAVDPLGRVWCGLPNAGVSVLDHAGTPHDPSDDRWFLLTHPVLGGREISAIGFQGADRVWFALGEAGGVALDFGSTLEDPSDDVWIRYDEPSGMPSGGVYSVLVEDRSTVWLGGCSYVTAIDLGDSFADQRDDVLAVVHQSNCTSGLAHDGSGVLWFANGWDGIRRYDTNGTPHVIDDDSWEAIRTSDGLLDNRTHSVAIAPDGRIWVGTDAGLTVLRWE